VTTWPRAGGRRAVHVGRRSSSTRARRARPHTWVPGPGRHRGPPRPHAVRTLLFCCVYPDILFVPGQVRSLLQKACGICWLAYIPSPPVCPRARLLERANSRARCAEHGVRNARQARAGWAARSQAPRCAGRRRACTSRWPPPRTGARFRRARPACPPTGARPGRARSPLSRCAPRPCCRRARARRRRARGRSWCRQLRRGNIGPNTQDFCCTAASVLNVMSPGRSIAYRVDGRARESACCHWQLMLASSAAGANARPHSLRQAFQAAVPAAGALSGPLCGAGCGWAAACGGAGQARRALGRACRGVGRSMALPLMRPRLSMRACALSFVPIVWSSLHSSAGAAL